MMVNTVCTFRMDEKKRRRVDAMAQQHNTTSSEIIRNQINDLLDGSNKLAAMRVVNHLKEKFQYIPTKKGKEEAIKERRLRERIIKEISKAFGLES